MPAAATTVPVTTVPASAGPAATPAKTSPAPDATAPMSRRAARLARAAQQPATAAVAPQPEAGATDTLETVVAVPVSTTHASASSVESPVAAPAAVEIDELFELIEPTIDPEPMAESEADVHAQAAAAEATETFADAQDAASDIDAFEIAARLFAFTGETPVQAAAAAADVDAEHEAEPAAEPGPAHTPARGTRVSLRRLAAASFSIGVMGIVGLLAVGMTTPAEAVAAASGSTAALNAAAPAGVDVDTEVDEEELQAYVAPVGTENAEVVRTESYDTVTMAELAYESGIRNFSNFFVNDPNSAIQWPFAVGVPISYGYGMRSGRLHEGIDFTPGAGSPIQSIAEGTVRVATDAGGAYGVHVIVDHIIDGQLISSHYAHMQYGSIRVQVGQQIPVGTVLGLTGNTGRSFGAHLHFELLAGGTDSFDPLPWLREHAGG